MSEHVVFLRALLAAQSLDAEEMSVAIGAIMDARWSPVQTGAFLTALAAKGETAEEIIGAAQAMRARGLHVEHARPKVVDVCGTGGAGHGTINISTCVGFVVASCGLPVAKHGNRAASSRCGSADVLEALGVPIDLDPEHARLALERDGFVFLFAQRYHPAMRNVAPVRRELGVRTIFNVLGPLTNPARATHQVVGVAERRHLELVGRALAGLGVRAAAVVHSVRGLDEIAGDVPTEVYRFGGGREERFTLDPATYGVAAPAEAIAGGDVAVNAQALHAILDGERSPRADVVALNAAMALLVAERVESLEEGVDLARGQLANGAAFAAYQRARRREEVPR